MVNHEQYERRVAEVSRMFPVGSMVDVPIYAIRHLTKDNIRTCKVTGYVTEERVNEGYQFGIFVEYEGKEYWVHPSDCILHEGIR